MMRRLVQGRSGATVIAALLALAGPARADREPEPLQVVRARAGGGAPRAPRAPATSSRTPASRPARDRDRRFETEREVQRDLEDALARDRRLAAFEIIPFVEGDEVTLLGAVPTRAARRAAGQLAAKVDGIARVTNRLVVRRPRDAAAQLADRVRRALAADPEVGGLDLRAQVAGRTVLLAGAVPSERDRRRATRIVARLSGVRVVVDELVLSRDAPQASR